MSDRADIGRDSMSALFLCFALCGSWRHILRTGGSSAGLPRPLEERIDPVLGQHAPLQVRRKQPRLVGLVVGPPFRACVVPLERRQVVPDALEGVARLLQLPDGALGVLYEDSCLTYLGEPRGEGFSRVVFRKLSRPEDET